MKTYISFISICVCFILFTGTSTAQINLRDKIKNQTNNRANKNVDQGINKSLDKAEEGVKGLFNTDKTEGDQPSKQTKGENQTGEQTTKQDGTQQTGGTQTLQSFSKYDFVPGDKVLLYEDFSQDAVGDFPALWTTDVAGEVNGLNIATGNWFNLNSTEGTYWFMNDIEFPKNFIIEFDIVPKKDGGRFAADLVLFGEGNHSEMDKKWRPGNLWIAR